jgi:hypothetical protein
MGQEGHQFDPKRPENLSCPTSAKVAPESGWCNLSPAYWPPHQWNRKFPEQWRRTYSGQCDMMNQVKSNFVVESDGHPKSRALP